MVSKYKKEIIILFGNIIALFILLQATSAQSSEGFIYGKVYTYNNVYQGQIRWGKEEAFWNDIFNASKISNAYEQAYRNDQDDESDDSWLSFDWRIRSIWEDKHATTTHQFSCQFGDIAGLYDIGRSRLKLQLKNGFEIDLSGQGFNDIGTDVKVADEELGIISIDWRRIDRIEFLPSPEKLKGFQGKPIYGTVETYRRDSFTGFVQWDHDERLSIDKLDGDTRDGDVSIAFAEIKSIEKEGSGCYVRLNSNREFYLKGSNDVNQGNRGVIVTIDGLGKIDIPWKEFKKVSFVQPLGGGPSYQDFSVPRGLSGRVLTYDDRLIPGKIVFDIDEAWEVETLEAKDNNILYRIPFRHIQMIRPKNYNYSLVKLKNGDELLLGDGRDVSAENDGLLLFQKGQNEPEYIPWKKVVEIIFD